MNEKFVTVRELCEKLKECDPDSPVALCYYVRGDYYAGYLKDVNTGLGWDSVQKRKLDDDEKLFVELNCYGVDKFGSLPKRR